MTKLERAFFHTLNIFALIILVAYLVSPYFVPRIWPEFGATFLEYGVSYSIMPLMAIVMGTNGKNDSLRWMSMAVFSFVFTSVCQFGLRVPSNYIETGCGLLAIASGFVAVIFLRQYIDSVVESYETRQVKASVANQTPAVL